MSFPGELLRDGILPPHLQMRVLLGVARSAFVLASNYHDKDEFQKIVSPKSLSDVHRRECNQLVTKLHESPFENTELIGSGSHLTGFERRIAAVLNLEDHAMVKEAIFRTTGALGILGAAGHYNDVDKDTLTAGIDTLDAMTQSLKEMYPSELSPAVSATR